MSIPTQMSLVGFIASAPELHFTKEGAECCRLRVGVEQWRKEVDGSFTKLDPTFHDMVAFESTARETYARFRKGDSFVASGYVHEYEVDGPRGQRHQGGVRRPQDRPQRQQDRLRGAAPAAQRRPNRRRSRHPSRPVPPSASDRRATSWTAMSGTTDRTSQRQRATSFATTCRSRSTGTCSRPTRREYEWHDLDRWVKWLKTSHGLPPSIVPPF